MRLRSGSDSGKCRGEAKAWVREVLLRALLHLLRASASRSLVISDNDVIFKGSVTTHIGNVELLTLVCRKYLSEFSPVIHSPRFTIVAEIFKIRQDHLTIINIRQRAFATISIVLILQS